MGKGHGRARGAFGVELPTSTLFQSTLSIAEIAAAVEQAQRSPGAGSDDWDDLADDLAGLSDDELESLLGSDDDR